MQESQRNKTVHKEKGLGIFVHLHNGNFNQLQPMCTITGEINYSKFKFGFLNKKKKNEQRKEF